MEERQKDCCYTRSTMGKDHSSGGVLESGVPKDSSLLILLRCRNTSAYRRFGRESDGVVTQALSVLVPRGVTYKPGGFKMRSRNKNSPTLR